MENSIQIFGKKYPLSKPVCWFVSILLFLFSPIFIWSVFGGIWRFGENYLDSGWISILFALILSGCLVINKTEYTLFPKSKSKIIISYLFFWIFAIYYWYTVIYM